MKIKSILFISILILFAQSCNKIDSGVKTIGVKKDSVSIWIKDTWNNNLTLKEKFQLLDKAYIKIYSRIKDSLSPKDLSSLAYRYYQLGDTAKFFKTNRETLSLALKRKDSFVIADAHWSHADYFLNGEIYDKAYYHFDAAFPFFNGIGNQYSSARMLYSMAFIKGRYRDYSGSEVFIYEAIKLFEITNDITYLIQSYIHLGLLQIDIKEYDKALEYFKKASSYIPKLKNKKNHHAWILNNIGLAYLLKGDYKSAINYFDESLNNNDPKDLKNFATIIDNRAISLIGLQDTTNVKIDLFKSLKIRDSIDDKSGILSSKIRISEYYEYIQDTTIAIQYAQQANALAKNLKNGADYLTTLEQLADLQPDKSNEYLHLYSHYSDSLYNADRKTANKFTRIEFETDEVLEDNKILNQQLVWIFAGSIALILILSLLYFIRIQKAKNEKLFLETEQQKANEQVYLLTLKKQAELEEEKVRERNRISQELHDGILGRLFGTRVGMGFLDLNADEATQKQHEAFLNELQEIEKEIREVSHKLNDNFEDLDVNFTTIVTQLLESKSQIGEFQFHLNIDENISWKSTDEIIKVNVYRIIQETLQNTIKHAKARNVSLDFSTNEQELHVQIKDDGVGFNQKKSKKGIGLKNIRSRIEKLNGTVEILSAPNKGTQIHIKIPIV